MRPGPGSSSVPGPSPASYRHSAGRAAVTATAPSTQVIPPAATETQTDGQQRHHRRPGVHELGGGQAAQRDHPAPQQRPGPAGRIAEQADQPGPGGQVIVSHQDGDQRVL
jgi:hypothetical protein